MPVTFQVVGNLADFGNDVRAGVKVRATATPGIKVGDVAVHSNQPETVVTDDNGAFVLELVSLPGVWYRIQTPYANAINTVNLAGYVPDVGDPTTGTVFPPGTVINLKDVVSEDPTPGYEAITVGATSVNGQVGAVVLDAADIGAATAAQGALADTAVQPAVAAATFATRRLSLPAAAATGVKVSARGTTPIPVDVFGGYLWGWHSGSIYRSSDQGVSWSVYTAGPDGNPMWRLIPTSDGEVVYGGPSGVWKSTGWATGSPTWGTAKATPNGTSQFLQFQIDGNGTKFIVAEYSSVSRADSRYGYISTDSGTTWTRVYDSVARYGATLANSSHIHGACYDPWSDRFYLAEGHDDGGTAGDIAGIYYSDDDGATWTRPPGLVQNPPPTAIVATDDGLVCGSDSAQAGMWGVVRQNDPNNETIARTYAWRTGRSGVIGFGMRGFREPVTGVVYIGFKSEYADVAPIVAGGTAAAAGLTYTWPTLPVVATDSINQIIFPSPEKMIAFGTFAGVGYLITGTVPGPGATATVDDGGVRGGTATDGTSVAIGARSTTGTAIRAVTVGVDSRATQQDSVAVGHNAAATADSMTMIGSGTDGVAQGTAVGFNAATPAPGNVAVGYNAATTLASSTAVGHAAAATGLASTATGKGATASGTRATVLGANSTATQEKSVALGEGVATSTWFQVGIGPRHIEMQEMEAAQVPVSAPAANKARIYVEDNGSGKTRLMVRFATGAAIQLAIEP